MATSHHSQFGMLTLYQHILITCLYSNSLVCHKLPLFNLRTYVCTKIRVAFLIVFLLENLFSLPYPLQITLLSVILGFTGF